MKQKFWKKEPEIEDVVINNDEGDENEESEDEKSERSGVEELKVIK